MQLTYSAMLRDAEHPAFRKVEVGMAFSFRNPVGEAERGVFLKVTETKAWSVRYFHIHGPDIDAEVTSLYQVEIKLHPSLKTESGERVDYFVEGSS